MYVYSYLVTIGLRYYRTRLKKLIYEKCNTIPFTCCNFNRNGTGRGVKK